MKQSDSTERVTPYELATLASRIDPERCASDPQGAIAAAQALLILAENACAREEADRKKNEEEVEALYKLETETRVDWARGIKEITRERRRDRATKRFADFMEHESPASAKGNLSHYQREGFTLEEVFELKHHFTNWKKQPKRKKGKQGRRISEHDGRLRVGSFRLAPIKSRKPG
jgi:hypothetical protein